MTSFFLGCIVLSMASQRIETYILQDKPVKPLEIKVLPQPKTIPEAECRELLIQVYDEALFACQMNKT